MKFSIHTTTKSSLLVVVRFCLLRFLMFYNVLTILTRRTTITTSTFAFQLVPYTTTTTMSRQQQSRTTQLQLFRRKNQKAEEEEEQRTKTSGHNNDRRITEKNDNDNNIVVPQLATPLLSSNHHEYSSINTKSSSSNVGGTTFGNLVLEMQEKERVAIARNGGNKVKTMKDQVLELDPIQGIPNGGGGGIGGGFDGSSHYKNGEKQYKNLNQQQQQQKQQKKYQQSSSVSSLSSTTPMDVETAKELDDSVSFPPTNLNRDQLIQNMLLVPLNPLYTASGLAYADDASTSSTSSGTLSGMTSDTLADSKSKRATVRKFIRNVWNNVQINQQQNEMPTLDSTAKTKNKNENNVLLPLLSRPEHYLYRIGRDRRHLAVSIAASIDTVDQWRTFCKERGGLYPLLETIHEAARMVQVQQNNNVQQQNNNKNMNQEEYYRATAEWAMTPTSAPSSVASATTTNTGSGGATATTTATLLSPNLVVDYQEETFQAACTACRSIRDLCAISPELAAIITDSILRTNASWNDNSSGSGSSSSGGVMQDFGILLNYCSDYTAETTTTTQKTKKKTTTTLLKRNERTLPNVNNNNNGGMDPNRFLLRRRFRRDTRFRCKLYVTQLLLAMTVASDDAVAAIRVTDGLTDAIVSCSSYALKEQTRRWLRYPGEFMKWIWKKQEVTRFVRKKTSQWNGVVNQQQQQLQQKAQVEKDEKMNARRPFLEAGNISNDLNGSVQRSANQLLAAIGYNKWIPKQPGQKGLRILSLDGGGSRGMSAVTSVNYIMEAIGNGSDVADSFDMIVGTSTGGIISFLIGLRRESSARALTRYQQLISKIFIKSALSTPLMLFTTATYDESHFMTILTKILEEKSMLDSRADPAVPLVCCLTSKMSSTPTHVALFRNYNYANGELPDTFTIDPNRAREELEIPLDIEHEMIRMGQYNRKMVSGARSPGVRGTAGSRHPGSFRVLQRYALRASTAAPTVFKPVMMGGEMYCDGGIVASNPTAVAIHEARAVFPNVPIELIVSVGTGNFLEEKSAPRIGWDGIIGQIVNSATDAEQIHHVLEDVLGPGSILNEPNDQQSSAVSSLRYFRFNPVIGRPDEFPIDVTDPEKLAKLRSITVNYLNEPEQQEKIKIVGEILNGRKNWRKMI